MKKLVCTVCDYVYEGDELHEDDECPLCGVGPVLFHTNVYECAKIHHIAYGAF